ncbi:MAG: outer membrane-stress sensor serine endopeptidase DegS [Enterobacteriaceae bacterium]
MFAKLFQSIFIGIVVALLLLLLLPTLRTGGHSLLTPSLNLVDELPVSFNFAARKASPAVVNVYNRSEDTANAPLGLRTLGSGVIMNEKGYILTNQHVINNAEQILVALQDSRIYQALLVGSDNLTDLAVLKIDADDLPTITINPKRVPHIGDVVLAIGNPYNLGQTVTQGIISAVGRNSLSPSRRQNFLQTDASINHGNSGGALINTLGELVGINTLSLDKGEDGDVPEGLGFAIPTSLAIKVMDKLIRDGRVIRGYIGIEGMEKRESMPIGNSTAIQPRVQGIIVKSVNPGGPAAAAGIQPGDILLEVNNRPATSAIEVVEQVAEIRPGTQIPILLLRNGNKMTLSLTIMEYPGS